MERITVGTWIWSKTKQSRGKVIEVAELWGTTQLRVWLPKDGIVLIHSLGEVGLCAGHSAQQHNGASNDQRDVGLPEMA